MIGRYKTEVIDRQGSWQLVQIVRSTTITRVDWFNTRRYSSVEAVARSTWAGLLPIAVVLALLATQGVARATAGQGAEVYVDGQLVSGAGPVDPAAAIVLQNGNMRLSRVGSPEQRAGILAEVLLGDSWEPATSTYYGDWTYLDSSVVTEPTEVDVLSSGPDVVAVRWVFGDHLTGPSNGPPSYPYPFEKTVWLRSGESGYFALITPLVPLPQEHWFAPGSSEHEVGFGGVYGDGSVSTSIGTVLIGDLSEHYVFNFVPKVDAARFIRDGDPLTRVLVPLPEGPLLVPVSDAVTRGGVFVHHYQPQSYGAYLYAAPTEAAEATRTLCFWAWLTSPFELRAVSLTELESCGPDPALEGRSTTTTSPPTTTSSSTSTTVMPPPTTTPTSTSTSTSTSSSTSTTLSACTSPRCVVDAVLSGTACGRETVPQRIRNKLVEALSLLDRADTATGRSAVRLGKRAGKQLRDAGNLARRASLKRNPQLSVDCAAALRSAISGVRAGLGR
jgi:hypothetical protein